MNARLRVPGVRRSLGFALVLPFVLAGCSGDAESAPDLEGEFFDASADVVEESGTAPAPPPASPPPSSAAPPPAPRPAPQPPASEPAREPGGEVSVAPAPEPPPVAISAGTRIPAVLEAALSTRTHRAGDTFHARVVEEVLAADGMVLVPEGARLEGRVAESRQSAGAEEEALLLLTFTALLIDGERIPMEASVAEAEVEAEAQASGARTAATVATGAAAGAVVGRILGRDTRSTVGGAAVGAIAGAGVALTTREGHAEMREGARIVIRLEAPALLAGG